MSWRALTWSLSVSTAAVWRGNAGDDPLARLLPVGNQRGFRTFGSAARDAAFRDRGQADNHHRHAGLHLRKGQNLSACQDPYEDHPHIMHEGGSR